MRKSPVHPTLAAMPRAFVIAMMIACGPPAKPQPIASNHVATIPADAAFVTDATPRWLCVGDYCSTSAEGCMMHRADYAALLGPDEYCAPQLTVFCAHPPHGDTDEDCQPTRDECQREHRGLPCVEVR